MLYSVQSTIKKWLQRPYVRVLGYLLLAVVVPLGIGVACNLTESESTMEYVVDSDPGLVIFLNASEEVLPGASTDLHLSGVAYRPPPKPKYMDYIWTPPPGATNFEFPDHQPEPGGPPFHFRNVPVGDDGCGDIIRVSYKPPPLPPGEDEMQIVNTLEVRTKDASNTSCETTAVIRRKEGASSIPVPPAAAVAPAASQRQPEPPARGMAPQQGYYLWETHLWLDPTDEITMTTKLCQDMMDSAQKDTAFVALRFPVLDARPSYTRSYPLPVVFQGARSPILSLLHYDGWVPTTVLTTPLEYRPERFTFLENELPAAEEEHWLALGLSSSDPITCPEELEMGGGDWQIEVNMWLDFGGEKNACADCVLPLYYCYEGQDPPLVFSLLARASGGNAARLTSSQVSATPYQGQGITCIGPDPLRMMEWGATSPPFSLAGTHMFRVSPTQTISLPHRVTNLDGPVTITLDYASSLGLPWGIYSGTYDAPAIPLVPITGPIVLEDTPPGRYFWMIAEVPPGTQGAETLLITATSALSPTLFAWTSDLGWVGDWTAPPLTKPLIYLPVVLRNLEP